MKKNYKYEMFEQFYRKSNHIRQCPQKKGRVQANILKSKGTFRIFGKWRAITLNGCFIFVLFSRVLLCGADRIM